MTELLSAVDAPSDAELVSRVRGGDVAAYGELFARHVEAARRLGRQLVRGPDVDDLVSDAFARTLNVLQAGGGPDVAFRAYLLTCVRRLHVDRIRAGKKVQPSDDMTVYDAGIPFQDTAVASFENGAAAKAFGSLPERWQLVLWHLEVEGQKPADIAPLLGMSANSVSALAYRAREGLRQAFLTMHLADSPTEQCRWVNEHLGAYVRKGLSRRDTTKVEDHLEGCRRCTAMYLELNEVNSNLAGIIAPLLLGVAGAGYVSSAGGAGLTGVSAVLGRFRDAAGAHAGGGTVAGAGSAATTGGLVTAGGLLAAGVAAVTTAAFVFGGTGKEVLTAADQPVRVVQTPPADGAPADLLQRRVADSAGTSVLAQDEQGTVAPLGGAATEPAGTSDAAATEPGPATDEPAAAGPADPIVAPPQPAHDPADPADPPLPPADPADPADPPLPPADPADPPLPPADPADPPLPPADPADPPLLPGPGPSTPNPGASAPGGDETGGDTVATSPRPVALMNPRMEDDSLRFTLAGPELPEAFTVQLLTDSGITFKSGTAMCDIDGATARCTSAGTGSQSAGSTGTPAAVGNLLPTTEVDLRLSVPEGQTRTDLRVRVTLPDGFELTGVGAAELTLTYTPPATEGGESDDTDGDGSGDGDTGGGTGDGDTGGGTGGDPDAGGGGAKDVAPAPLEVEEVQVQQEDGAWASVTVTISNIPENATLLLSLASASPEDDDLRTSLESGQLRSGGSCSVDGVRLRCETGSAASVTITVQLKLAPGRAPDGEALVLAVTPITGPEASTSVMFHLVTMPDNVPSKRSS